MYRSPIFIGSFGSPTVLQYASLNKIPYKFSELDKKELEELETGGSLELQRWLYGTPRCENVLSAKEALEELIDIETQGRVGFIFERRSEKINK